MARKRMFSLDVVYTDKFISLPLSAQALYFHLGMQGDDDGFVSAPMLIMRGIGAETEDLKELEISGYVICFDSGVLVITDWRINNDLKNDRYRETAYTEELKRLDFTSKRYTLRNAGSNLDTTCIQNGDSTEHNRTEHNRTKPNQTIRARDMFEEFAGDDSELLEALRDFEEMRRKIKKPLTDKAKKTALNKLKTFNRQEWIAILNQSTFHCWQGIFPLKESENTSNPFLRMIQDGEV